MTAEDDNPRQITGGPWRRQPKAEDDNPRQITGGPWRSPGRSPTVRGVALSVLAEKRDGKRRERGERLAKK
jgi:hypothetical protein